MEERITTAVTSRQNPRSAAALGAVMSLFRARSKIALVLPFLVGCAASITVKNPGPTPSNGNPPTFESAAVTGLVLEQARVTGTYAGSSSATAVAVAGPNYALATAASNTVAATYDYQKSYEAQDYLRMLLEDTRIVRRVTPKSDVEIRGVFLSLTKTTGALDIWNYGSQILLFPLALIGTPLFGSREAAVDLRVYRDGELLGSFVGRGDCFGRGNVYNAAAGIRQLEACARGNAIANGVHKLQEAHLTTGLGQATPGDLSASANGSQPSVDRAVVRIRSGPSVGSGFFVTENLVATNAHVVHGNRQAWISFSGGKEYVAAVEYEDAKLDFALVRSSERGTPLPVRHTPIVDGEGVTAIGFPQGRRVVAASTGTVHQIAEWYIQHDALIAGGSSGGPLLDANSNVIGINTLLSKAKGDRKNESDRGWALKMSYILESLPKLADQGMPATAANAGLLTRP